MNLFGTYASTDVERARYFVRISTEVVMFCHQEDKCVKMELVLTMSIVQSQMKVKPAMREV